MGFRSKKEKINGKAFIMIALLVFLVSGAWGACYNQSWSYQSGWASYQDIYANCNGSPVCTDSSCDAVKFRSGYGYYTNVSFTISGQCYNGGSCGGNCRRPSYCSYTRMCDTQEEADSLYCELHPDDEICAPPPCDSTYHCESVYTENNVVRSNITLTDCHGDVLQERQVLGSCSENDFCEGEEVAGSDSCSYPEPDPDKCKFGGQNGSLCTYVCPDGKLHSCRIAWTPGQPSEYQNCPQKPPSDCVTPASSSSVVPDDSIPDYPTFTSSSSTSPEPDPDCPECEYLQEIRDTLHRANEQRRFANYVLDSIKQDVGGFGAQFNSIISNTAITVNKLNTSNSSLSAIASTNSQIANKLNSLDLDNITASVDSIVVHVETENPDSVNFAPWRDLDSLPVWRDTLSVLQGTLNDINGQIDTLVQDSNGVNALKKYLPYIKKIYDDVSNFYSGFTLPAMLDSLSGRLGLDTLSIQEQDSFELPFKQLDDSTFIEGNWWCEEHCSTPATQYSDSCVNICMEVPRDTLEKYIPPEMDTAEINDFFRQQDSILDTNKKWLEEHKNKSDTVTFKDLAGDSAMIRQKLNFLFLPENTLEQCFEFRLNTAFGRWTYNLAIDFADLFGLDLCDLIRKIVRVLTFILIVVTTIKGYIRAFGGGGPGGG